MKIDVLKNEGNITLSFDGKLDEEAFLEDVSLEDSGEVCLDFERLSFINSCGIRNWINWVARLSERDVKVVNAPKILVDQINMINGIFTEKASVDSFKVPYFCESCDNFTYVIKNRAEVKTAGDLEEFIKCSHCEEESEIDVNPKKYLRFYEIY